MGYESKVFIVHVNRFDDGFIFANKIAEVEMNKMGYGNGWRELFKTDIDYKLYMDDGKTEFDTDRYGEHLKSCTIEEISAWVEKEMQHSDYNWKLPILRGLIEGLRQSIYHNLEAVHFGH